MHRYWNAVVEPVLSQMKPKVIVQIGLGNVDLGHELLVFSGKHDSELHLIDPYPDPRAETFLDQCGKSLGFHRSLSLDALPLLPCPDVVLLDGDHNWYTVFHELKLIEDKSAKQGRPFPVVFVHHVGWPYGKRDVYCNPANIPPTFRQVWKKCGLKPESPELVKVGGLYPHRNHSVYEHNVRNGVLTAVEDFLDASELPLELTILPMFFGLGILVSETLLTKHKALSQLLQRLDATGPVETLLRDSEAARLEEVILQTNRIMAQKRRIRELESKLDDSNARIDLARTGNKDKDRMIEQEQKRTNAIKEQVRKGYADADRLIRCTRELQTVTSAVLTSKTWKAANRMKAALRTFGLHHGHPPAELHFDRVKAQIEAWEQSRKINKEKSLLAQPEDIQTADADDVSARYLGAHDLNNEWELFAPEPSDPREVRFRPKPGSAVAAQAEAPIFVFAAAWRTGSTLLQRIINAAPGVLIWGENTMLSDLHQAYRSGYQHFSSHERGNMRVLEEELHMAWTATMSPKPAHLEEALRRFFSCLYVEPSMSRGRPRWGIKEVRSNATAISRFLLELYPEARFIYLVRDPYDTLSSCVGIHFMQLWENLEQTLLETWTSNTRSFCDPDEIKDVPHRLVKYEDLIKQTPSQYPLLQDLMDFLDLPVTDGMFEAIRTKLRGFSEDEQKVELTPRQCELVTEITRSLREQLAYPDRSNTTPMNLSEEQPSTEAKSHLDSRLSEVNFKKPLSKISD